MGLGFRVKRFRAQGLGCRQGSAALAGLRVYGLAAHFGLGFKVLVCSGFGALEFCSVDSVCGTVFTLSTALAQQLPTSSVLVYKPCFTHYQTLSSAPAWLDLSLLGPSVFRGTAFLLRFHARRVQDVHAYCY